MLLTLGPGVRFQNFLVTGPDKKTTESLAPSANSDVLEIIAPQLLGQWTVTAKDADNRQTKLGFSVNPPVTESQFVPLEPDDLDAIFGKDGYALAEDAKPSRRSSTDPRRARDLSLADDADPVIVTLENLLANTFYKECGPAGPAGAAA